MRHQPSVYINLCNHNKCIEIVHYPCGHYYIRQYMQWGPVKNYVGRNDRHRITLRTLRDIIPGEYVSISGPYLKKVNWR